MAGSMIGPIREIRVFQEKNVQLNSRSVRLIDKILKIPRIF